MKLTQVGLPIGLLWDILRRLQMNKEVEEYKAELKRKLNIAINQNNLQQANVYRIKIKTANKIIHLYESDNNFELPSNDFCW
jgi:hypothetical protein